MSMKILRNDLTTLALNAFDASVKTIGKALARVAKGQKIVDASEDASQYAISERMRNMIRDLDRSSENIQNESTMLKIAEGAISSTLDIVNHMREKAMQAADVNMTDGERQALQKEMDALIDQIDQNSRVQFNNKFLLDGGSSPMYSTKYDKQELVARALNSSWIKDSLAVVQDTYGLSFQSSTSSIHKMNVYIDEEGDSAVTTSISESGDAIDLHFNPNYFDENYMRNPNGISTESGSHFLDRQIAQSLADAVFMANIKNYDQLDSDIREGLLTALDGGDPTNDLPVPQTDEELNSYGADDLSTGYKMIRLMANKSQLTVSDFAHEFARTLSEGWNLNDAIEQSTHYIFKTVDAVRERAESLTDDELEREAGIRLTTHDIGSIDGEDSGYGGNKSAYTAIRETSTPSNWRLPSKPTTFAAGIEISWKNEEVLADTDGGGGFQFQIGANAYDKMNVGLFNMSARALGLIDEEGETLKIDTRGNAKEAVNVLDRLVSTLLQHQADIGALHMRVNFTTENLQNSSDNIQSAESIIRDADMAKEMVDLNRGKALEQASQSVLAQANQNSEKVLQVLSNESAPIEVHANTIQAKHTYDENLSEVGKDLKQISTGEKVTDPTDGSSSYQMGENVRAKLRVLEQDSSNVQTGSAIIKVAQGTIEAVVNDLNSLKELAVNAANGYNNDVDRRILQKNFDQIREQINDLVSQTTYNGSELVDGRYQRFHMLYNSDTAQASIGESLGLTVHHGTESGQSVRFYMGDMHTKNLGGANVKKEDLDALLTNREFIDSRNAAEIESLTELQSQLEQMREDTNVLRRDENLQERLQGVFERFESLDDDEDAEVNVRQAVMREYLDNEDIEVTIDNLERYEFLKPMLEEAMVVDGLSTRLDEEGNVIETDTSDDETAAAKDIDAVEVLKDAAGKSLDDAKIETIHDANVAMKIITSALDTALNEAASVGAYLSRLDFTGQNISSQIENTENMDSTIRDADMAKSMTKYMRDQMLTRASQTMLSQAIHDPIMVLTFTQ